MIILGNKYQITKDEEDKIKQKGRGSGIGNKLILTK